MTIESSVAAAPRADLSYAGLFRPASPRLSLAADSDVRVFQVPEKFTVSWTHLSSSHWQALPGPPVRVWPSPWQSVPCRPRSRRLETRMSRAAAAAAGAIGIRPHGPGPRPAARGRDGPGDLQMIASGLPVNAAADGPPKNAIGSSRLSPDRTRDDVGCGGRCVWPPGH